MNYGTVGYETLCRYFNDVSLNKAKDKIRIISKATYGNRSSSFSFDYFELDENGIIKKCPRGYTKEFKGTKVIELEKFPPMMFLGREL